MSARKKSHLRNSFSEFIDDPMVELAILVVALVSLMFSILEFVQVVK